MDPLLLVNQCYEALPSSKREKPWVETDHGRKVLCSEDELNAYVAAYGEMHVVKCRAAFQNFPFDDIRNHPFEIFDWGCGQGLGTLTFLHMLQERNMLGQVARIYLIEPSLHALNRACSWVQQYSGPGVEIVPINKYIPGDNSTPMPEVFGSTRTSINILSNILDIRELSLSWIANKTSSLADVNYMLCVGPKFVHSTNSRLDDFCGYFSPNAYFSRINTFPYSYTSKTHHAYGCETRCFVHERGNHVNYAYVESADAYSTPDPYDYAAEVLCGSVDKDIVDLYNNLRQNCEPRFSVFFRPAINSDTADFVLVSPNKGIVLLNVCEDISRLQEDIRRIEGIKENFFDMHLRTIKIDSIVHSSVYNSIKVALFFPNNSQNEIRQELDSLNTNINNKQRERSANHRAKDYFKYLYTFNKQSSLRDEFSRISSPAFKEEYYNELVDLIASKWHSYRDGNLNFRLSARQKDIVRHESKRLRVKGVAGCGKTQVVANRAVEQHIRTGEKVLIITFNISLIQYIKMRINQVPADFSPNMFEVINYHQFFKSKANLYSNNRVSIADYDNPHYFDEFRNLIKKYKSIIIDEVQDFKEAWLQSIIKNFLAEDGSVSLFGDGEQNIYDRELEAETKMPPIRNCGFSGRWNEMSERVSMRMLNTQVAALSSAFAQEFISADNAAVVAQGGFIFDEYYIKYWNKSEGVTADSIAKNIKWIIDRYQLASEDVAILGQSINLLRDVEAAYVSNTGQSTMINFETQAQYKTLCGHCSPSYVQKDLEKIRHAAKTHFTTSCSNVKLSTIHSFKGWESKSIILILQPNVTENNSFDSYRIHARENTPALIYTALTRAKCNLFIINLNNVRYHDFFNSKINTL